MIYIYDKIYYRKKKLFKSKLLFPIALMSSKRNQLKTVKAKTNTKDRKYYWKIK